MFINNRYDAADIQLDGKFYLRLNEFYWYQFKNNSLIIVDEKDLEPQYQEFIKENHEI